MMHPVVPSQILVFALVLGGAAAGAARAGEASPTVLNAALERAAAGGPARESLRLLVECQRDGRLPALVVHGRGVGIWDGSKQIAVPAATVREMAVALRDGGFADLAPSYGGRATAAGEPDDDAALKVTCRIQLAVDGLIKQVVQLDEGEHSEALARLADRLYALAAPSLATGVGAASLADGLMKIGLGELAPETLTASLHRKPELEARGPARAAFLLHLEGRTASSQSFTRGQGYGPDRRLELGAGEIAELAETLAARDPGRFPANLWAPDYNDLVLQVLDHRVAVQARPFSGMTPATHAAVQPDFDAVADALARLAERVAREGELAGD